MNDSFLYTIPQWFVFAGLFMIIYGWVESKKSFRLIGISIFILLGIYSLAILLGDYLTIGNYLTPEEVVSEEIDGDILNEVPFQAKLLPAYWSFLLSSVLAIPSLFLDWKDKKYARTFIVITGLVALLGFFIVVGTIRSI
ncbi:hypothetical protein [uncultured Draconibacterium sp.]|uniref:hypothetical protein n=1 Tax=uncultured Draconibacterium sp. TaxID=1573823 RepID=UPI003216A153